MKRNHEKGFFISSMTNKLKAVDTWLRWVLLKKLPEVLHVG